VCNGRAPGAGAAARRRGPVAGSRGRPRAFQGVRRARTRGRGKHEAALRHRRSEPQTGPAVKYMAETRKRYWITHHNAPARVREAKASCRKAATRVLWIVPAFIRRLRPPKVKRVGRRNHSCRSGKPVPSFTGSTRAQASRCSRDLADASREPIAQADTPRISICSVGVSAQRPSARRNNSVCGK
jgi:hypothetical protein